MRKEANWYRLFSAIGFKLAFKPGRYFSAFLIGNLNANE